MPVSVSHIERALYCCVRFRVRNLSTPCRTCSSLLHGTLHARSYSFQHSWQQGTLPVMNMPCFGCPRQKTMALQRRPWRCKMCASCEKIWPASCPPERAECQVHLLADPGSLLLGFCVGSLGRCPVTWQAHSASKARDIAPAHSSRLPDTHQHAACLADPHHAGFARGED